MVFGLSTSIDFFKLKKCLAIYFFETFVVKGMARMNPKNPWIEVRKNIFK